MTTQPVQPSDAARKVYNPFSPNQRRGMNLGAGLVLLGGLGMLIGQLMAVLGQAPYSWLIIVFAIAAIAWAISTLYVANTTRLVISAQAIEWRSPYLSLTTTWDNVEQIEQARRIFWAPPQAYLRLRERPRVRGLFGQYTIRNQPVRIPVPFGARWQETAFAEDIKQHAPRLWQD